jgi:hypothetical protein
LDMIDNSKITKFYAKARSIDGHFCFLFVSFVFNAIIV